MNLAVPSSTNNKIPAMIHRTAQGEGSFRRLAERSMRRSLSSLSILDVSQCRQDFCFRGRPCGEKTAERPHDECEGDADAHNFGADSKIERNFAERHEAANTRSDVVER